ncbi:hypothetical protein B0H13DRAFT_2266781 [Mycena leptocephala]|nr:hypothetical protein B0H13DRAFT_2266781 [Mycena leptocephala]
MRYPWEFILYFGLVLRRPLLYRSECKLYHWFASRAGSAEPSATMLTSPVVRPAEQTEDRSIARRPRSCIQFGAFCDAKVPCCSTGGTNGGPLYCASTGVRFLMFLMQTSTNNLKLRSAGGALLQWYLQVKWNLRVKEPPHRGRGEVNTNFQRVLAQEIVPRTSRKRSAGKVQSSRSMPNFCKKTSSTVEEARCSNAPLIIRTLNLNPAFGSERWRTLNLNSAFSSVRFKFEERTDS